MNENTTPYKSLNIHLREKFGTKVVKLSLDGGFTCPNRDGKLSTDGCIFCSVGGSGDFAGNSALPIKVQIDEQKIKLSKKWKNAKYIAYFQAFTNTYAPIEVLREKYYEALSCEDIVGIAIATRPDCLEENVLNLLDEINKKTYLWVELGLQTSKDNTAKLINRGYETSIFTEAVKKLNALNIEVVTHLIFGLPHETHEDIMNSVKFVTQQNVQGIKIQLLHVLKNTPLATMYNNNEFNVLTKEAYINLVCDAIKIIPKNMVIHRLTGDGASNDLIAPLWSNNKKDVLNSLNAKILNKF